MDIGLWVTPPVKTSLKNPGPDIYWTSNSVKSNISNNSSIQNSGIFKSGLYYAGDVVQYSDPIESNLYYTYVEPISDFSDMSSVIRVRGFEGYYRPFFKLRVIVD